MHRLSPRRGLTIGAGIVAILVIAAVGVSMGAASHHSPGPAAVSSTPRQASGGSSCGLAGMDPAGATLTTAPAARWATVGTMAAPASPTAGPGRIGSDGLRSCYAHTVTGAVFAVANFWATGSDPRLYRAITEQNVATGPGQQAALQQSGVPANTGQSAQIAGFKVLAYRPTAATVDVALQSSDGQQIGFPIPLVWQDGDWKIQLADDGSNVFRPTILQTLTGYIPWTVVG